MTAEGFHPDCPEALETTLVDGFQADAAITVPFFLLMRPLLTMVYAMIRHPSQRNAKKISAYLAHFGVDVGIHSIVEATVHVLHIVGPAALMITGEGAVVMVVSKLLVELTKLGVKVCRNLAQPSMDQLMDEMMDDDMPPAVENWRETAKKLHQIALPKYQAEWFYVSCWLGNTHLDKLKDDIWLCCGPPVRRSAFRNRMRLLNAKPGEWRHSFHNRLNFEQYRMSSDSLYNHPYCSRCMIRLLILLLDEANVNWDVWSYIDMWVRSKKSVMNYLNIQSHWSEFKNNGWDDFWCYNWERFHWRLGYPEEEMKALREKNDPFHLPRVLLSAVTHDAEEFGAKLGYQCRLKIEQYLES